MNELCMEVCKTSQNMRYGSSNKVKLEEEAEAEEALIMQNQSNNICSSNKQNSIFSLTLDEFQYKVSTGKSSCFGSMNMDEFLNSVWNNNAEGSGGDGINQATAAASSNSNQNQPITNPPGDDIDHQNRDQGATCTEAAAATLIPQSSFTCCIPTPLCNKTVEEVWSEINKVNQSSMQQQQQNHPNTAINNDHQLLAAQPQQSLTFGEMTLEDFLIKAGVVNQEASSLLISSSRRRRRLMLAEEVQNHYHCGASTTTTTTYPSESTCCLDIVNNINNVVETAAAGGNVIGGFELSINDHSNSTTGNGNTNLLHNGASMFTQSGRFVGESSTNINGKYCARASDVQAEQKVAGRRRSSGPLEVAVERRQRRMIKNRESAARSRARKQAYTAELEIELNQLREENAGLKQILAEAEMKRRQEVIMKGKQSTKVQRVGERFRTLRRTSSLAW